MFCNKNKNLISLEKKKGKQGKTEEIRGRSAVWTRQERQAAYNLKKKTTIIKKLVHPSLHNLIRSIYLYNKCHNIKFKVKFYLKRSALAVEFF